MGKRNVEDYLTEGIYGAKQTKKSERKQFLGTIRERIVIALTIGQVMTDKGLNHLENAMKENTGAKLLLNGHVSYRFLKEEKILAKKYNIAYTVVTDEKSETDMGAVLAYDYAIDKGSILIKAEPVDKDGNSKETTESFFSKLKKWFTS